MSNGTLITVVAIALVAAVLAVVFRGSIRTRISPRSGLEVTARRESTAGRIDMKDVTAGRSVSARGTGVRARRVRAQKGDVDLEATDQPGSPD